MSTIYFRWIVQGRISLEDVPARWRQIVEAMLREEGYYD